MTQTNEDAPRSGGVEDQLAKHGRLSYLEIPAVAPRQSATFYHQVAGWSLDERTDEDIRFRDTSGLLIGRWATDLKVWSEPGLLPYIYVADIEEAIAQVATYAGEVIKGPFPEGDLLLATVRDPAGNIIGLWQAGDRG